MEQVIIIDAMKRASAKRITAVVPYYGYSRQDKKTLSREPISAKLVADMLRVAGADRIVSVDLHSGQIQGYFDCPFDHLTALPLLSSYLKDELGLSGDDLVVVAPDAGRIKTSEKLREYLHADLAYIYKRRSRHEATRSRRCGSCTARSTGRPCVMIDDMIDTAGTLVQGAKVLATRAPARSTPAPPTRSSRARPADPRGGAHPAARGDQHRSGRRGEAVLASGGCSRSRRWSPRRSAPCSRIERQRDLRGRQPGLGRRLRRTCRRGVRGHRTPDSPDTRRRCRSARRDTGRARPGSGTIGAFPIEREVHRPWKPSSRPPLATDAARAPLAGCARKARYLVCSTATGSSPSRSRSRAKTCSTSSTPRTGRRWWSISRSTAPSTSRSPARSSVTTCTDATCTSTSSRSDETRRSGCRSRSTKPARPRA